MIDSRLNTTVQATLNLGDVAKLPIVLPPRSERERITQILGTLDDKIELNRRMNETLEAMARALFKSWFVDFDPVRAKAEGRDLGLPKHLADLFDAKNGRAGGGMFPGGVPAIFVSFFGWSSLSRNSRSTAGGIHGENEPHTRPGNVPPSRQMEIVQSSSIPGIIALFERPKVALRRSAERQGGYRASHPVHLSWTW